MKRFIEGVDRSQTTLFPDRVEDWIDADNPVRVIDVFVDELDLFDLGFERVAPHWTGRPGYHPAALLKLYIYGYLNRVQSSRRLEREAGRNVEVSGATRFPTATSPEFGRFVAFRHNRKKGASIVHPGFMSRSGRDRMVPPCLGCTSGGGSVGPRVGWGEAGCHP